MESTRLHASAPAPVVVEPPAAPRSWVRRVRGGGAIVEQCPAWCTAPHAADQDSHLDDLLHAGPQVATHLHLRVAGEPELTAWPVLAATIMQQPYQESAPAREPYVHFEPAPDDTMELDPDALADVITQLRAHCDGLERVHAQLVQARADHTATAHS